VKQYLNKWKILHIVSSPFDTMRHNNPEVQRVHLVAEVILQLIAVPKARIRNLLFWDVFKEFPVSQ
jgi:hypothetical protein